MLVGRRQFMATTGYGMAAVGLGFSANGLNLAQAAGSVAGYELPKLGYAYDALEPYIDAKTMEIHHTKHHQGYINNAVKLLTDHPSLASMAPEKLLGALDSAPETIRGGLRNNVGGHVNHTAFWESMGPGKGGKPTGKLMEAIAATFDSWENFQNTFNSAAGTRFGSGWAWLVKSPTGLEVMSTPNQDSPLMDGKTPLLGLDVWEHAYYLNYQNRRADYVKAWWSVINWDVVTKRFNA